MNAKDLIIVGGAPRSGTSLVQKILGFHTEIAGHGEFDHLSKISKLFKGLNLSVKQSRNEPYFASSENDQIQREILDRLLMGPKEAKGARYLSEKTPSNVLEFEDMFQVFEGAKMILVVRDPRAVAASLKTVVSKMSPEEKRSGTFGKAFDVDMKEIRRYMNSGFRFYSKSPRRCHLVRYEDLVSQPEKSIRELCQYLEIDFQPAMMETSRSNEASKSFKRDDAWYDKKMYDRGISKDSLDNWRDKLNQNELKTLSILFAGGDFCTTFGYDIESVDESDSIIEKVKRKLKG